MAENTSHTGAPGNPVNEALSKAVKNFSKFTLVRNRYQTQHFGLIEPHFVCEGVPTDRLPLQSSHNLRSYTLSNILMSDIKMHKEYFFINYDAVLPKNWQKVYENPTSGSDVLPDVNSCIPLKSLFDFFRDRWSMIKEVATFEPVDEEDFLDSTSFSSFLSDLLILEMFTSSGSLLRTLGVGFSDVFLGIQRLPESVRENDINFIDWLVDAVCSQLAVNDWKLIVYKVTGSGSQEVEDTYYVRSSARRRSGSVITFREALSIMRERPYFRLVHETWNSEEGMHDSDPDYDFLPIFQKLFGEYTLSEIIDGAYVWLSTPEDEYFNFSRVVAYQLVCAHYFTNDHVDYVYSAELFEQAESSLYQSCLSGNDDTIHTFQYNGLDCLYDTFSGKVLQYILSTIANGSVGPAASAKSFLTNLFGFRRSLRYRDYFIGSKPTPLALGDTNVAVNNNLVSIIDTTKGIATQRFLNQVNRIGRRIKDYIMGLFPGASVQPDIHEPSWLARTDHDVKAIDNENTASEQYELGSSVTSVLRSSDSRYIFECEVGRAGIVLGVTYYDVPRAYPYSIDKHALAADRFDMFIPQFQFIGDQPISSLELGRLSNLPFGYTLRDMQYKQSFDIAVGGFVDSLPGWCFLAPVYSEGAHISPDVIRSRPAELDSYFLSLSGYSLATYFHFILHIRNVVDAKRPMVYAPSIL